MELARDPDPAVRANAVWSLGSVGDVRTVPAVVVALSDRDVNVAMNAAAALACIAAPGAATKKALCAAMEDPRSYVRANAYGALSLVGTRCDPEAERAALSHDPSPVVRAAAARLLARANAQRPSPEDSAALSRCVAEDPNGGVAMACKIVPDIGSPVRTEPVAIYVVPIGEAEPVPGAPFALALPNGLMRAGRADQRGLVYEAEAPSGAVRLEIPAPLAD
jgi:hypothetical protein